MSERFDGHFHERCRTTRTHHITMASRRPRHAVDDDSDNTDTGEMDELAVLRAVAAAFDQVLGPRDIGPAPLEHGPLRPSRSRCSQCHRCHDPSLRCRCYACGNLHHAGICAMSSATTVRCPICSGLHAPGPCAVNAGPLAAHCAQCGRDHRPGTRCKCRECGGMHLASDACFVRAPSSQDVYVGAAFSRQPVVAYDCGAVAEACPHCGALFFDGESQYLSCCRNGTIVVQQRMVRI